MSRMAPAAAAICSSPATSRVAARGHALGVLNDTLDFHDEVPHALWCAKGDNEDIRDQGHHAFSCSRQRPPAADPVLSVTDGVPPSPDSPMPAATGTRRPPGSRAHALETTFPLATDGLKG
jgi:hypothetical protein